MITRDRSADIPAREAVGQGAADRNVRAPMSASSPAYLCAARSHTTSRFGEPRQFAGALGRAGGEQLVNVFELEAGLFAELADHRCDAELEIIAAQEANHLPVFQIGTCCWSETV